MSNESKKPGVQRKRPMTVPKSPGVQPLWPSMASKMWKMDWTCNMGDTKSWRCLRIFVECFSISIVG